MTKKMPTLKDADGNTIDIIELPCSGCDGKVGFGTPETTERPTFFHTEPYCERFERTNSQDEMVDYFVECRDKHERQKTQN